MIINFANDFVACHMLRDVCFKFNLPAQGVRKAPMFIAFHKGYLSQRAYRSLNLPPLSMKKN